MTEMFAEVARPTAEPGAPTITEHPDGLIEIETHDGLVAKIRGEVELTYPNGATYTLSSER